MDIICKYGERISKNSKTINFDVEVCIWDNANTPGLVVQCDFITQKKYFSMICMMLLVFLSF